MTAESTIPNSPFDASELIASLRRGLAMILKVFMGGLVVIAAGILAVALAMVGLILASVAVIYRMVAGEEKAPAPSADGDGMVLDARRTAHGWTVE